MSDTPYLIWLSQIDGLGPKKQLELVRFFGSARAVFDAPNELLRTAPCLTGQNIARLTERRDRQALDDCSERLERAGIGYISYFDPDYPPLLREIQDPPAGLYIIGEMPVSEFPSSGGPLARKESTRPGGHAEEQKAGTEEQNAVVTGQNAGASRRSAEAAKRSAGASWQSPVESGQISWVSRQSPGAAERSAGAVFPPMVSVIGSRRCSEYGLSVARKLSRGLAENGVVIVSGMAKGIDAMAHRGALEGGGKTVAVLGCGADICYPAENKTLREAIIRNGCVISEYPPGTPPAPGHFPARNRIISGLSSAVVVVEAAKRSGTLITVSEALEQGRDVMAVPGNVTSRLSEGTNALIKEGAGVATCCEDVLEFLGIEKRRETAGSSGALVKEAVKSLAPDERIIYDALKDGPAAFDEIVARSNSQAQTVGYVLMMLELKGLIRKLPGMRYERE